MRAPCFIRRGISLNFIKKAKICPWRYYCHAILEAWSMNKTDLNSLQISTNARQIEGIGHTKAGLKANKKKQTPIQNRRPCDQRKHCSTPIPSGHWRRVLTRLQCPLGMGMENVKRFSLFSTATILLDLPIRGTQVRIAGNWLALKNT